ncbi:MAG: hypothetical protein K9M44_00705 [Candidatus Pacebacteria bacterium]|nr:hypothetical protein [Candidatus Paceibacterota bacterium]
MSKTIKISLLIIAGLLVLNGLINISDNGSILAYDITAILSGIGFTIVALSKKA